MAIGKAGSGDGWFDWYDSAFGIPTLVNPLDTRFSNTTGVTLGNSSILFKVPLEPELSVGLRRVIRPIPSQITPI